MRFSGVTTDITERKEAENRQVLLAGEVDHRAKNALAVVQAIVRLAKRDSVEEYVKAVEGRIGALAQTHELLSQSRWEGADIQRLVLDELAPYLTENQRVVAIGPSLVLAPGQAQLVAMAVHELATNAAKYGSLSVETGKVDVTWSTLEGMLHFTWVESGGPPVVPPAKLRLWQQDHPWQYRTPTARGSDVRMAAGRPAVCIGCSAPQTGRGLNRAGPCQSEDGCT